MTKEKDLGSDAVRSNPDTADQDRETLQKRVETNIERSRRSDSEHDASKQKGGQPTPGSEAVEPSPEK